MAQKIKHIRPSRSVLPVSVLLILLCVAGFLDGMDVSSMGVVLPIIQHSLHMNAQSLQWIISGYVLGYGGFMLLGGRIADLYGRKRVFIISMVLFALASLVGGFAQDGSVLVASRIIKGVCAGFTAPAALALLLGLYADAKERNRALGIFSSTAAVGFATGVAIGGFLGDISWRLVMFLPVPFVLLVVALGAIGLRPDPEAQTKKRFDLVGAILGTAGLLTLVLGATQAATYGWLAFATWGPLLGSILLLAAFLLYEHRIATPLMPLSIFRRPGLGFAGIMAFFMQGNYVSYQFVAALYFRSVLGWSGSQSALAFVFAGLIVVFMATRFAGLALRIGSTAVVALGMTLEALGFLWFFLMHGHMPALPLVAVTQLLIGSGVAASLPSINITGLVHTKEAEHGLASGIVLSAFQIGGGVLVAVTASVYAASNPAMLTKYTQALLVVVCASAIAATVAITLWRHERATK
ncbi:MAG TPA: MFS transporter [Bacillota bacterium]|nr:MFS transporter [Bacillota bacterium]